MRTLLLSSCVVLGACTGLVGGEPSDAAVDSPDAAVVEPDAGAAGDAGVPGDDAGTGTFDAGTPDAGVDAGPSLTGRVVFAIGGQDMRHLVSFDGGTWEHDTYVAPNGEDNAFSGVAVGKGGIVMSGDPGIYRSTDGVGWTLVQTRPSRFSFHGSVMGFGGGQFVMVAQDQGWRSGDGLTWESKQDTAGQAGHWHALAFGNGRWVALGDLIRKVSDNGLDWHDPTPFAADLFTDVAWGNGRFVAVGKENNDGWVAASTDGLTWAKTATVPTPYQTGLASISFGNGVFVTSTCCSTLSSPDGVTWTTIATNGAGGKIVFGGDRFVSSGWRTQANVLTPDAGHWVNTFGGDQPNLYDDAGIAPWFTAVGAGEL